MIIAAIMLVFLAVIIGKAHHGHTYLDANGVYASLINPTPGETHTRMRMVKKEGKRGRKDCCVK